jgi:hypothetical protein
MCSWCVLEYRAMAMNKSKNPLISSLMKRCLHEAFLPPCDHNSLLHSAPTTQPPVSDVEMHQLLFFIQLYGKSLAVLLGPQHTLIVWYTSSTTFATSFRQSFYSSLHLSSGTRFHLHDLQLPAHFRCNLRVCWVLKSSRFRLEWEVRQGNTTCFRVTRA